MLRWGNEKTMHFIKCYREHDSLWNPASPLYKDMHARQIAYQSLLDQFNDKHLNIKLLKAKIKNFRTTYHQELNKIRESERLGGPRYKPSVCWFEEMDAFLSDLQHRPITWTKPTAVRLKRKHLAANDSESQTSSQNPTLNSEYNQHTAQTNDETTTARKLARKLVTVKNTLTKKREHNETVMEVSDIENLNNVSTITTANEDEFHHFGMNIAAQLRTLPIHVALKLQTEFQNELYLARVREHHAGGDEVLSLEAVKQLSDSDTSVHNVEDKVYPVDVLPIDLYESDVKVRVFKKAWDE